MYLKVSDIFNKWLQVQEVSSQREDMREVLTQSGWWQECGATVIASPRQTGKSTSARGFADVLIHLGRTPVLVSVPSPHLPDTNAQSVDLVCDEFFYYPEGLKKEILSKPWKSLTIVSTMKL